MVVEVYDETIKSSTLLVQANCPFSSPLSSFGLVCSLPVPSTLSLLKMKIIQHYHRYFKRHPMLDANHFISIVLHKDACFVEYVPCPHLYSHYHKCNVTSTPDPHPAFCCFNRNRYVCKIPLSNFQICFVHVSLFYPPMC